MAETMRAAVLYGVGDLRVEEVPKPELTEPDWVLLRIRAVGICGSDIHFFRRGRIGNFILSQPTIMGHESAGEVVEVGPAVKGLSPGDLVAIEPGRSCRRCEFCKTGHYNLCPDVIFLAAPPVNGAFCEYLTWPADYCFKLPASMTVEEGAMMEPMSVGMHAARLSGVRAGDTVAVLGSGPIGLTALMASRAHGATEVYVTDLVPSRLEVARSLGAAATVDVSAADPVEAIREMTGGRGVDVAMDCVGSVPTLQQSMKLARDGGAVQLVGMPAELMPEVPIYDIINRELTVRGIFRYANCYPPSIALAASGAAKVGALITHHFSLDEAPHAMAWVDENKDKVIKAIIHP
jgi:L-iditol 2-dehydrogenase